MKYYIIVDYAEEKELVETSGENEDGDIEVTYSTVTTEVPIKQYITKAEADYYIFNSLHAVYIESDDGTMIGEYFYTGEPDAGEELVGYATANEEAVNSNYIIATTTYSISIDSIESNTNFTTIFTPTKTGYTLIGVIGYTFTGTGQLMLFRAYVDNGTVSVACRNIGSVTLTDKTLTLTLLWVMTSLVNIGS